jgi:hypothetical protein
MDTDNDQKNSHEWQELTRLTQGRPIVMERIRMVENNIAIEGRFELPQLAQLSAEDQVFVTAFIRSHGSIKEMEKIFGVSYPTIKARLNRISGSLEFADLEFAESKAVESSPTTSRTEILDRLQRGEISAQDALRELEAL